MIVLWRFTDGKKGHEKQTQGLVQGLKLLPNIEVEEYLLPCNTSISELAKLPCPTVIAGAGHATHIPMLCSRLIFGGRTVVLMKPTIPAAFFDLVFLPQHDTCSSFGNVFSTEGVLSPSVDQEPDPACGVVLLGGTSRHFPWNAERVSTLVEKIARQSPEKQWTVCDSPRTPTETMQLIQLGDNIVKKPWQETDSEYLTRTLATSSATWVTCDSVTMLYEALATRATVGVLLLTDCLSAWHTNKLLRGIRSLALNRRVHLSSDGLVLAKGSTHPIGDHEIMRCAEIVAGRMF